MTERPITPVAVGILRRPDGRVLFAQRPPGKVYAGYWEFPGGKIEPGEAPVDALTRELAEELGCRARVGRIDEVVFHAYEEFDLYMLVYVCALEDAPRAVEVAQLAWVAPAALPSSRVLPADVALVERLARQSGSPIP